jgi:endonuclease IV
MCHILYDISNNVATKDFENMLKEIKHKIGVTNDEIDNLYQKV